MALHLHSIQGEEGGKNLYVEQSFVDLSHATTTTQKTQTPPGFIFNLKLFKQTLLLSLSSLSCVLALDRYT